MGWGLDCTWPKVANNCSTHINGPIVQMQRLRLRGLGKLPSLYRHQVAELGFALRILILQVLSF